MALLTVQQDSRAGLNPAFSAVSASDTIANLNDQAGRYWYHVKNAGGSPDTVTIGDPGRTAAGNLSTGTAVTVAAGAERVIALGAGDVDPATGLITITHSFTTSVTAGVFGT